VVKLTQKDDLVADPTETFTNLCWYQIKLNSLKCVFGIATGQLLDFVVSKRGIEANPEKIAAITRIAKPACLRDVHKLVGRVAALSRFIPRLGEKGMLLYRLLKKSDSFTWKTEADDALASLKLPLQNAPILAAPAPKEPMLMYIAATNRAVSAIMVVEQPEEGKEHRVQRPVYYISEVLTESKQCYPHYQKLVYAVFRAQWRLCHYFHEHPVTAIASTPCRISSSIVMRPSELPSGQLRSVSATSPTSRERRSSLRPWRTSSSIGRKRINHRHGRKSSVGLSSSMAPRT
jgi:hypothetical protein